MAHYSAVLKVGRNSWAVLLLIALAGASVSCTSNEEKKQVANEATAPRIEKLLPPSTTIGKSFQIQPSGESAISIAGSNFTRDSKVMLNGKAVATGFGGPTSLSAMVSADLYAKDGAIQVTVVNADGATSNAVPFQVFPLAGAAPQVARVLPNTCAIGHGFSVQPDGRSALGVEGSNFLPGAKIYFDQTPLETAFAGGGALAGIVPSSLLRTARTAKVSVRNPDGKASNTVDFSITK
jgi:IPT/TIG domain